MIELLPRFHGMPTEYSSIRPTVEVHYRKLTEERNSRFRVVETRKTFISNFSNRQQKPGEKVEDYAADLKRLYDKAHPKKELQITGRSSVTKILRWPSRQQCAISC